MGKLDKAEGCRLNGNKNKVNGKPNAVNQAQKFS